MPGLVVIGLFAFAVLVGVISAARRSSHDGAAAVTAWNARADRLADAQQEPAGGAR